MMAGLGFSLCHMIYKFVVWIARVRFHMMHAQMVLWESSLQTLERAAEKAVRHIRVCDSNCSISLSTSDLGVNAKYCRRDLVLSQTPESCPQ